MSSSPLIFREHPAGTHAVPEGVRIGAYVGSRKCPATGDGTTGHLSADAAAQASSDSSLRPSNL